MNEVWTVQKLIQWTSGHFSAKEISSSRLDAELLLAHTLRCRRLDLYLNFEKPVEGEELKSFRELVKRRAAQEPVAYILGKQEFYSRSFMVGPGVLIPRPETEQIVEEAKKALATIETMGTIDDVRILDVGAGSGCLGLTLAKEVLIKEVVLVDPSERAKLFTLENAKHLEISDRIFFVQKRFEEFSDGDQDEFDLIVSNPPYVARAEALGLMKSVFDFEPHEALFGGQNGWEILMSWIPLFAKELKPKGFLFCEIGHQQGDFFKKAFEQSGLYSDIMVLKDYSGHDRVLSARRKEAI